VKFGRLELKAIPGMSLCIPKSGGTNLITRQAILSRFIKIGVSSRIGANESNLGMGDSEKLILKWDKTFQIFWFGEKMDFLPTNWLRL
jgi:hypothetical protein